MTDHKASKIGTPERYRALYKAGKSLMDQEWWASMWHSSCFLVELPGEEYPVACRFVPQKGNDRWGLRKDEVCAIWEMLDEWGDQGALSLRFGKHALWDMRETVKGTRFKDYMDAGAVVRRDIKRVPEDERGFYKKLGRYRPSRGRVPQFVVRPPGGARRDPDDEELERLGLICQAVEGLWRHPDRWSPTDLSKEGETILVVKVEGELGAVSVSHCLEPMKKHLKARDRRTTRPSLRVDEERLRSLGRRPEHWALGVYEMPKHLLGGGPKVQFMVVTHEESQLAIQGEILYEDREQVVMDKLVETFEGQNIPRWEGMPRQLDIAHRELYPLIRKALQPLGVRCIYQPRVKALEDAFQVFVNQCERSDRKKKAGKKR